MMSRLKTFCFTFFLIGMSSFCFSQPIWETLTGNPMLTTERPFSFSIDSVIYVGGGRTLYNVQEFSSELWAYDMVTDSWTQKNDIPGIGRRNAVGFRVGDKGYMGFGYNGINSLEDFYRYTPETDSWEQLADFPGGFRDHSLGISGDEKGYVGAGRNFDDAIYHNDLWEFEADTETWTLLGNFQGEGRWRLFGWKIGETIYLGGGGEFNGPSYSDLWAFDLNTQIWTEKTSVPTNKTKGGFYFQINGLGYFLEGATIINQGSYGTNLFVYDPQSDEWAPSLEFIGPARIFGFSESFSDRAVIGVGRNYLLNDELYGDAYSFIPNPDSVMTTTNNEIDDLRFEIHPNPSNGLITLKNPYDGPVFLTITNSAQQVVYEKN